jgi:hypothetical protein
MAVHIAPTEILYSEGEKDKVRRQLDRMLANVHFSNSKRFPSFLRFVVEEELAGRGDQLKERTLGLEVFGRDAAYDTTSDPIVRVTAAEIRKRIAQYYQEPGHASELRISLPPGSYIPHFAGPESDPAAPPAPQYASQAKGSMALSAASSADVHKATLQPSEDVREASPRQRSRTWWLSLMGSLAMVLVIAGWMAVHLRQSPLDKFWAPILGSGEPVVVCFPQSHFNGITLRDAADPAHQRKLDEQMSAVIVDDLQPLVSISGLLEMRRQSYILMGEDTASLTDLRRGPAIFIGAFDNAWTLRVTRGLRFRFGNDADMTHFWIEDTQSPTHTYWGIDRRLQEATNNYRDYAIVARFRDATTGKMAVVVAGIARGGTVAAGEFITQPGNMDAIKAQAGKQWGGENMEFVLSTEIIDGRSAPPKVEGYLLLVSSNRWPGAVRSP